MDTLSNTSHRRTIPAPSDGQLSCNIVSKPTTVKIGSKENRHIQAPYSVCGDQLLANLFGFVLLRTRSLPAQSLAIISRFLPALAIV